MPRPLIEGSDGVRLGARQLEYARLYANGFTMKEIAHATRTTLGAVESAVMTVKQKYRRAGSDVHTKADVRRCLDAAGLLDPDSRPVTMPTSARDPNRPVTIIIRDVPREVRAAISAQAEAASLTRQEYLLDALHKLTADAS